VSPYIGLGFFCPRCVKARRPDFIREALSLSPDPQVFDLTRTWHWFVSARLLSSFWLLHVRRPEARPGFASSLVLRCCFLVSSLRAADSAAQLSVCVVLLERAAPVTRFDPFPQCFNSLHGGCHLVDFDFLFKFLCVDYFTEKPV
jgi:hypothetical protein